jgi:hypothetical protein
MLKPLTTNSMKKSSRNNSKIEKYIKTPEMMRTNKHHISTNKNILKTNKHANIITPAIQYLMDDLKIGASSKHFFFFI